LSKWGRAPVEDSAPAFGLFVRVAEHQVEVDRLTLPFAGVVLDRRLLQAVKPPVRLTTRRSFLGGAVVTL
jgi:hypothetical protein